MSYLQEMQKAGIINLHGATPVTRELSNKELTISMNEQKAMFQRVIENNKNRIYALEKEVGELALKLKKATEFMEKLNDKDVVSRSREALYSMQNRKPVDRPIDRNNVAPKDVDIQKIFYFGNK